MLFVLDASITAAWALPDETSVLADNLLTQAQTDGAVAPSLWWYEIRNILLIAERRKRITAADADAFLRSLARLDIRIEEPGNGWGVLRLARSHLLSVYDAAYLELALRESLPLGTLDRDLARAAKQENISVLSI
ncbi:MAG: type II toxin-antitoxin system VapC family toxin [Terracidiphilus sp.]